MFLAVWGIITRIDNQPQTKSIARQNIYRKTSIVKSIHIEKPSIVKRIHIDKPSIVKSIHIEKKIDCRKKIHIEKHRL